MTPTMRTLEYDPNVDDEPEEVRAFDDLSPIRDSSFITDGTLYSDDSNGFGLLGKDVSTLGESDAPWTVEVDPRPVEYDRAERVRKTGEKVWVFNDGENDIAVKWEYIKLVRDIYGITLDEIRRDAKAIGEVESDDRVRQPDPILIDIPDREYRPVILPHLSFSD